MSRYAYNKIMIALEQEGVRAGLAQEPINMVPLQKALKEIEVGPLLYRSFFTRYTLNEFKADATGLFSIPIFALLAASAVIVAALAAAVWALKLLYHFFTLDLQQFALNLLAPIGLVIFGVIPAVLITAATAIWAVLNTLTALTSLVTSTIATIGGAIGDALKPDPDDDGADHGFGGAGFGHE